MVKCVINNPRLPLLRDGCFEGRTERRGWVPVTRLHFSPRDRPTITIYNNHI